MPIQIGEHGEVLILLDESQQADFMNPTVGECVVVDFSDPDIPFHEVNIRCDPEADVRNQQAVIEGKEGDRLMIIVPKIPVRRIRPSQIGINEADGLTADLFRSRTYAQARGFRIDFLLEAESQQ